MGRATPHEGMPLLSLPPTVKAPQGRTTSKRRESGEDELDGGDVIAQEVRVGGVEPLARQRELPRRPTVNDLLVVKAARRTRFITSRSSRDGSTGGSQAFGCATTSRLGTPAHRASTGAQPARTGYLTGF
jgi:hypothetical protein